MHRSNWFIAAYHRLIDGIVCGRTRLWLRDQRINRLLETMKRTFCVAPMLDWTDRHERYFLRLISRHALLYTEMVTTGALLRGDAGRYLSFSPQEHPLALQLGGSEPKAMAQCARMAEDYGYDEVNINVGCPSDRVKNGQFGACLMATPERVAECVAHMQAAVKIPITVKHRIGIDEQDSEADLERFVSCVSAAGCQTFIVHARKAWLQGLNPKQNRDVPPLDYARVYRLKQTFPALEIILNGGLTSMETAKQQLQHVDGVMLGREIYHNPYLLASVDRCFYADAVPPPTRHEVVERLLPYVQRQLREQVALKRITRHILGLFHGQPGAKAWRRILSEKGPRAHAGLEVLKEAWSRVK